MKHNHNVFIFLIVSAIIISIYLILKNEVFNKNKEDFSVVEFIKLEQEDISYSPKDINVYSIQQATIPGAAGASRQDSNLPKIGFKPEELSNLDVSISSENGIELVDNASLVPYLHSQIIYLTNHVERMADQFNELVNEMQNK